MANPSPELIAALRQTARRLDAGAAYRWTHMGLCNCGHLAQTVTHLSAADLHRLALEKAGDWSDQALDHCPTSGYPIDHVIDTLLDLGLTRDDLLRLERLADAEVLARLPEGGRRVRRDRRTDVVGYLRTWADILEDRWLAEREAAGTVPDPATWPAIAETA